MDQSRHGIAQGTQLSSEQIREVVQRQSELIRDLKRSCMNYDTMYTRLYQKYAMCMSDVKDLKLKNEALAGELDSLVHSRSFRLTAPLRFVMNQARGWLKR